MANFIQNAVSSPVSTNAIYLSTSYLVSDGLIFGDVFQRYMEWDKTPFLDWLEREGAWLPIVKGYDQNRLVRWHEMGMLQQNAKIASFTGGATAGAFADIVIDASSHSAPTVSPFNVTSQIFVNGLDMVVGQKTLNPNANVLRVFPKAGSTIPLNTVLATGAIMVPGADLSGVGTGYQNSNLRVPTVFSAQIGFLKKKKTMDGSEATNAKKVALPTTLGGKPLFVYQMDLDNVAEHKKEVNNLALVGRGGSFPVTYVDGTSDTLFAPEGLCYQVETRGNYYPYQGSLTKTDVYDWTRVLIKNGGGREYYFKPGFEVNIQLEQLFGEEMRNGGRIYMEGAGKKYFDNGFEGMKLNDTMFLKQPGEVDDFNNPVVLNAPGMNYAYAFLIHPIKTVEDAETKQKHLSIAMAYPEAPGPAGTTLGRRFEVNKGGENGINKDSEIDVVNFRIKTEFSVVARGTNMAIFGKRTDLS